MLRLSALKALLLAPLAFLAASCSQPEKQQGEPALYRIDPQDAPAGAEPAGWLFGTIHALPSGSDWRTAYIDDALRQSGALVVEIADLDPAVVRDTFARLSVDNTLPPLDQRVSPEHRDELDELLDDVGVDARQFRYVESWAVAISLSALVQDRSGIDPDAGVDRALIAEYRPRPIVGLETIEEQFSIFDRLTEDAQQDLLESLLVHEEDDPHQMANLWLAGDTEAMAGVMDVGLGDADGEEALRKALLTDRNRRWVAPITAELESGRKPFVAVGAGHIGGADGLIVLLEQAGWKVSQLR